MNNCVLTTEKTWESSLREHALRQWHDLLPSVSRTDAKPQPDQCKSTSHPKRANSASLKPARRRASMLNGPFNTGAL